MENAQIHRRSLSQTEQGDIRQSSRRVSQLTAEKRTASAVRSMAIDREIRQLNERCEKIIGAQ
jgi:hypothetical protein